MHRCIRITATRSIYKTAALSCELLRYLSTLPRQIRMAGAAVDPGPRLSRAGTALADGHATRITDHPHRGPASLHTNANASTS